MPGRDVIEQLGSGPVILPSLLLCDFANLQREVEQLQEAGIRGLHLDVMDGQFVPNLTYGMPIVDALRKATEMPLDVHLMIDQPERYLQAFANAGADLLTVHIEACEDIVSTLSEIRSLGMAATCRVLECCAMIGATALVGPYHSALGLFSGQGPTDDEWQWGVESMRQVAEHAGQAEVTLAVECLNRFETYLLNTHADSARFVREVDHPNCRMMYDTFHANIEEKSIPDALRGCADVLCHVHISENDRSTPGQGNVRWAENFDTLKEIGYDGWMVVEAFGLALPELAAATKIWRRMYESELQLASDSLAFMKSEVSQRWE